MTEPFYAFANLVLDSSLPLPELQRRAGAAPNCRIDLAPAPPAADDAWPCPSPREIRKDDGGHGYTIDFGGTARFEISADGDHVCCRPAAGTSDAALRHLLLDHVLPRVLCLRGLLVLHASTLRAPDGRAVAFLGASGAGKSTLAASLVAAGWRLLADDALVIEGSEGRPTAVPTYPGLRLWPDSAAWLASGSEPGHRLPAGQVSIPCGCPWSRVQRRSIRPQPLPQFDSRSRALRTLPRVRPFRLKSRPNGAIARCWFLRTRSFAKLPRLPYSSRVPTARRTVGWCSSESRPTRMWKSCQASRPRIA